MPYRSQNAIFQGVKPLETSVFECLGLLRRVAEKKTSLRLVWWRPRSSISGRERSQRVSTVKPDCQLSGAAGPPYEFCQSLTRLFSESVKVDCLAKECPTNDQRRSRSPRHATRGLSCESISPADKFRCRRRASDGRRAKCRSKQRAMKSP